MQLSKNPIKQTNREKKKTHTEDYTMKRSSVVIMAPESPVFFPPFSPTSVKTPSSSPRSTPPKLSMVACPPRKPKETTISVPDSDTVLKRKRPPMLDLTSTPAIASWCGTSTAAKTPEKAAEVEEAEKDGYYSVYCKRGRRGPMEDRYFAAVDDPDEGALRKAFFGVFDGHGGPKAAEFAAMNLGSNIEAAIAEAAGSVGEEGGYSIERAIRDGYIKTDEDFLKEGSRGGACCVTALISDGELTVSNAGDCRAVISRGGAAEALTTDHNPSQANELKRIEALVSFFITFLSFFVLIGIRNCGIAENEKKNFILGENLGRVYTFLFLIGFMESPNPLKM